jgi:hypothetical protein
VLANTARPAALREETLRKAQPMRRAAASEKSADTTSASKGILPVLCKIRRAARGRSLPAMVTKRSKVPEATAQASASPRKSACSARSWVP